MKIYRLFILEHRFYCGGVAGRLLLILGASPECVNLAQSTAEVPWDNSLSKVPSPSDAAKEMGNPQPD